jgi:hypothetical protein
VGLLARQKREPLIILATRDLWIGARDLNFLKKSSTKSSTIQKVQQKFNKSSTIQKVQQKFNKKFNKSSKSSTNGF